MRWRWRPAAEVAAGIVRTLLADGAPAPAGIRTFPLTGFQEEAVAGSRRMIERRGGVIVADEVGLGKTYIALALIEESLRAGEGVAVVLPAAVRSTWTPLVRRLERAAAAETGWIETVTHARLGRGTHDAGALAAARLVVVDEAHAFRNPATRRYRALAEGVGGGRLVLITATPVNNSLADLYHLIRLFAADDAFSDVGVASLRGALLEGASRGAPGEDALRVIGEVMVRRTREQAKEAATDAALRFPARSPTRVIRYDDPRVPALVHGIERLELAPYGGTVDALLRLGLLKRLESGAAALEASLRRLRAMLAACADAAERGRLLRPADGPRVEAGDCDAVQLVLEEVVLDPAPPGTDLAALGASARRDVATLAALLGCLAGPDPKLAALRQWAAARRTGQKAVLFTEFRDTAAALWRALVPLGGVGRVDGGGAWLGDRPAGRRAVVERFAPVSSGAPAPPPRERVDLLVATDVLSEGLNLQDAGIVVCYDLPWNPVRTLQRIGRVDRLGSLQPLVQAILFLPGHGLDAVLRLTRALRHKLGGIAAATGAARAGELLALLGGATDGDALSRVATAAGDGATPGAGAKAWRHLEELLARCEARAESAHCADGGAPAPPAADRLQDEPPSLAWAAGKSSGVGWLVLLRHAPGRHELVRIAADGHATGLDGGSLDALATGLAATEGPPAQGGPARVRLEEHAGHAARSARLHVRRLAVVASAPAPLDGRSPEARLGRRIRAAMAALGPAPEPDLLRRADALLARLSRPARPAARRKIEAVLDATRPEGPPQDSPAAFPALLARIEAAVEPSRDALEAPRSGARSRPAAPVVVAVLGTGRKPVPDGPSRG